MLDIKTYTWQTKTQPAYLGIEVLGGGGERKEESCMNIAEFKNTPSSNYMIELLSETTV